MNSKSAKARLFHALKPFLTGGVGLPGHDEVARRFGISIDTFRSHLSRLRGRYREFFAKKSPGLLARLRTWTRSCVISAGSSRGCASYLDCRCRLLTNRFCAASNVVRRLRVQLVRSGLCCVNCLLLGGLTEIESINSRFQHYEVRPRRTESLPGSLDAAQWGQPTTQSILTWVRRSHLR